MFNLQYRSRLYWWVFLILWWLVMSALCAIIDFNGLYGQDSYEYLRYANVLGDFFESGKSPGDYFWPVGYPLSGAVFFWVENKVWILQSISILSAALSLYYIFRILQIRTNTNRIDILSFVFLFFVLSPFVYRFSVSVMSDLLTVFLIVMVIYHYLKYTQEENKFSLIWIAFFFSAACMVRYAAAVVLLPFALHSIWIFFKRFNAVVIILGLIALLVPLIPHFRFKSHAASFLQHTWIDTWSWKNFFARDFNTAGGEYHYTFPNLLYAFSSILHPGFVFMGIVFVFYIKRQDFNNTFSKVMLISVILYALFIAGISYQNMRFLLLSFPLIIILMYPLYVRMIGKVTFKSLVLNSILIVQLFLIYRALDSFMEYNKQDKEVSSIIQSYHFPHIYTHGLEGPLRTYLSGTEIEGLSMDTLSAIVKPSAIILDEKDLAKKDKFGALQYNWLLISSYDPVKINVIHDKWSVYEIR